MTEAMIEKVMEYTNCTFDDAKATLEKTNYDMLETLSLLINIPQSVSAPKQKVIDETQQFFTEMRKTMDKIEGSITLLSQSECSEQGELQIHPEEMVQQSNCCSEYHPPTPELVAEKQEIECAALPKSYAVFSHRLLSL
jgi:hypothetical protein